MRKGAFAFLLGVMALQTLAALPDARFLLVASAILPWLGWRVPRTRPLVWLLFGFLWAWWRAGLILDAGLPPALEGRTLRVEGRIAGLPEHHADGWRFQFEPFGLEAGGRSYPSCGRLRLTWDTAAPVVRSGERWRFNVRLKRPYGLRNPGGFDFEEWLYRNRLRATGRVLGDAVRIEAASWSVDGLRERLRDRLDEAIGAYPHAGLLVALAIGDQSGVDRDTRQAFQATGTSHLLAISGLHVGLVAAIGYFFGRWLWSLPLRTLLWIPAPRIAALSGLAAASGYALLAGFEVPAQRTLIMIAVFVFDRWRDWRIRPSDSLLLAAVLVVIADPLAVLSMGFWLSFVAVAILFYAGGRSVVERSLWSRLGRAHLVMAIGLAPLLMVLVAQNPVLGPLANLVAVPWISFVVVPLAIGGTLSVGAAPFLGFWLLRGALLGLDLISRWLNLLADRDFAVWHHAAPGILPVLCAAVGVALLLMPRGLPGRAMGAVWMLPLILNRPAQPPPGEVWFTLLDVGQGLSAVVRTATHTLVFDTGAAYRDRFDAGSAVLLPYLWRQEIDRVDTLIVSHGDRDHIGGAGSLLAGIPVGDRLTSVPRRVPAARSCYDGQRWTWDGVAFTILNPAANAAGASSNNGSCVLRVVAGGHALLLTGDIEAPAEARLLDLHPDELAADVLVAPHHGSKTSSSRGFIAAVRPRYVLYPVGYRNAYHFPHPAVRARYRVAGIRAFNSAEEGAVEVRLGRSVSVPAGFRRSHRRYWHTPWVESR